MSCKHPATRHHHDAAHHYEKAAHHHREAGRHFAAEDPFLLLTRPILQAGTVIRVIITHPKHAKLMRVTTRNKLENSGTIFRANSEIPGTRISGDAKRN
jgi:hypothetical protein